MSNNANISRRQKELAKAIDLLRENVQRGKTRTVWLEAWIGRPRGGKRRIDWQSPTASEGKMKSFVRRDGRLGGGVSIADLNYLKNADEAIRDLIFSEPLVYRIIAIEPGVFIERHSARRPIFVPLRAGAMFLGDKVERFLRAPVVAIAKTLQPGEVGLLWASYEHTKQLSAHERLELAHWRPLIKERVAHHLEQHRLTRDILRVRREGDYAIVEGGGCRNLDDRFVVGVCSL